MSHNKKPRKAYRPRQIATNTLGIALHYAAKPAAEDSAYVLDTLHTSVQALCADVGTMRDWSIVAGSVSVALAIERQGIVRGLQEHLASAEVVLQAIFDRCSHRQIWLRPSLSFAERETMHLMYELHTYQVQHLGRAEFLAAMNAAEKTNILQGNTSTLETEPERLAA